MRRSPDLAVGFVLGFAVMLLIFLFSSDFTAHYEICEPANTGAKDCASYNMLSYAFHKIGTTLDALNGAITAIATAFIAWFTLSLRQSTDKLWEAGERQIAIANVSAETAQRAAVTAERALTVVERAFIMISDISIVTISQYHTIIVHRINVNVLNSGRTPARNYVSCVNLVVVDDLPHDFRFADRTHDGLVAGVIGPQSRTYFQVDVFIQDALATHEGRKKTFIYGWMEYDDIFPDSARHRTEFCVSVEVFTDPRVMPEVISGHPASVLTVRPYGRYNAYDEDCLYRPGQTPIAEEGELPVPTEPLVISPPPGFQQPPRMNVQFQYAPTKGE
ncbi:hypothetical protein S58_51140 [Bradyrhizobium oligotrophicum S58]|uniref:Uncharacterized protein n=1 Tax=Bradyrhizobium oligotrophicum S58 TaxID=1245469 RepID=M4ZB71_9BRAD|nr:hypothetical protein [Bradyrhizobium oligotrophicum]BAM91093.1 hypothetical protein S58_51140 [Bradyrhizobium oligotrophicum S58]